MDHQTTGEFIRLQSALTGRYSLQRELGRGGMGIVYLAHDVALDRPVAIKFLQPRLSQDASIRLRFLDEARTAARLSHPNIIPIFAVEDVGDVVFFVMAYVDGETLGQRIRTRGPLPSSELARILRDAGWGLAYAHAQGVIHRDVKADNIMIERGSGRVLVVDFGIARVLGNAVASTDAAGAAKAGELLGTADYMSPEQARGEAADQRSDIYALGVVAFYALAGKLPFEGATAGAVLAKHISQAPPSVHESVPGIPAKLGDAVDRCLAKEPDHRFASAEQLTDAVELALVSRREAPFPIRHFVKGASDAGQNVLWLSYFVFSFGATAGLMALAVDPIGIEVFLGLAATFFMALPVVGGGMIGHVRELLKSGYTRDDVAAVWDRELQLGHDERVLEHGRTAGVLERFSLLFSGIGWATIAAAALIPAFPFADQVAPFSYMAAQLGGLLALWRYDGRTALSRRLTGWFLKSGLGRRLFGVAGVGLDREELASRTADRPTELALGMAVDSLFDALPAATRAQLAELPSVVRRLEADAMMIRQRLEQLNDAAERAAGPLSTAPAERREAADRELASARDAAKRRLAAAVTALETIRLDLLRMTAGSGSVESLTADLSEARALSEDVGRLVDARREVNAVLSGGPPQSPPAEAPIPRLTSPNTGTA